jgi:hypothetical protein
VRISLFGWPVRKARSIESISSEASVLLAKALDAYGTAVSVGTAELDLRHGAITDLKTRIGVHEARRVVISGQLVDIMDREAALDQLLA